MVDNAINGHFFDDEWVAPKPTRNTQSIEINRITGEIKIVHSEKYGGAVYLLVPSCNNLPLEVGKIPHGRIAWQCIIIDEAQTAAENIPKECRSLDR